jgi:protein-tyrosine-phosphatase
MKYQSKRNNYKKKYNSKKKQRGGLFGFGNKNKKKNPKQKFREVIDTTYIKILEHRVKIQISNNEKLLKLTKDILTLEPIEYKQYIDKIVDMSNRKTDNYKNILANKNWKKLISSSEEKVIKDIAYKQLQQYKDSYTDTNNSVNYLSDNLVRQFFNQVNKK